MKLIYNVDDKPKFGQTLLFALQQLLAILAATIAVPAIIGNGMSQSAALFGAGVGTIVYLLFTRFKSPVFLGSSFAFIGSMLAAFAGGVSAQLGYVGLIIGAAFAGLVYVVIAIIVKLAGVKWISKLMPAVVIGPTVAIIGLSLAGNAIGDLTKGNVTHDVVSKALNEAGDEIVEVTSQAQNASPYICLICGLVTLFVVVICSVYGKKMAKMIPFIIGIAAGYIVAAIFTVIGNSANIPALQIINFSGFSNMKWVPEFTFVEAIKGIKDITPSYIATIAVAYIPVAFVVFAEHIADHKNLSSIIERDLLEEPGLHRTLLGDGIGSFAGAFFGGCPNTTYGESVGCVAISGNASVVTILSTAILAIAAAFVAPFTTFLATIPSCVMGGVCMTLYGFIAVSGLKMLQPVDLGDNRNLFTASVILIAGIGGLTLSFGKVTITSVACALILGIITNLVLKGKSEQKAEEPKEE
ncbi:MAG: uracil-xanthine permease [Clostridia bacterium]|nr:uracil-xanthine permease [Clostridia bacterium]